MSTYYFVLLTKPFSTLTNQIDLFALFFVSIFTVVLISTSWLYSTILKLDLDLQNEELLRQIIDELF